MQHEKVMGFLCSQNAIRTTHALQAKVVAMSCGKVNIYILLRKLVHDSVFITNVKTHLNLVKEDGAFDFFRLSFLFDTA